MTKATPMMQQYLSIKEQYQDHLLFYRMGDFYELFFDDATKAAEILNIVLTKRGKHFGEDIAMCGVPAHSSDHYLEKLISSGYKIAICEQTESPEDAKKRGHNAVVRREVVRIVTPGTILEENILNPEKSNYIASISHMDGEVGIAWADISTGEFKSCSSSVNTLDADIQMINPKEMLISSVQLEKSQELEHALNEYKNKITPVAEVTFDSRRAINTICDFFKIKSINAISNAADVHFRAIGALLEYIKHTQKRYTPVLSLPKVIKKSYFMQLDRNTIRSLEIFSSYEKGGDLLNTIKRCITSQGQRLFTSHLAMPLSSTEAINNRLDVVEYFYKHNSLVDFIRTILRKIPDIERDITKITRKKGGVKALASIRLFVKHTAAIASALHNTSGLPPLLKILLQQLGDQSHIHKKLDEALVEDVAKAESNFFKESYNEELAKLYSLKKNQDKEIKSLRDKYSVISGIDNIKISYNKVLGHFIDITPANNKKAKNVEIFQHKQSLTNSIRYKTEELYKLEEDILRCDDRISLLEGFLLEKLYEFILSHYHALKMASNSISHIDVSSSLAYLAHEKKYVKPIIHDGKGVHIEGGEHPVIASLLNSFIPNDCNFTENDDIWLITGPNMAGKSTFLRQNAIIIIMAQMGSFVPAKYAKIGAVDAVFSRVGAYDNIAKGESTFMVEMSETANILNNATDKSFVILDEIGRGTSTYDGLSLAWSILEYLHDVVKCKTLFATHYHEITNASEKLDRMKCKTVMIKEEKDKIIFMHRIIDGTTDKSYGIHVASIAGLPKVVIDNAKTILNTLESNKSSTTYSQHRSVSNDNPGDRVEAKESGAVVELMNAVKKVDVDDFTPKDALTFLYKLKELSNH